MPGVPGGPYAPSAPVLAGACSPLAWPCVASTSGVRRLLWRLFSPRSMDLPTQAAARAGRQLVRLRDRGYGHRRWPRRQRRASSRPTPTPTPTPNPNPNLTPTPTRRASPRPHAPRGRAPLRAEAAFGRGLRRLQPGRLLRRVLCGEHGLLGTSCRANPAPTPSPAPTPTPIPTKALALTPTPTTALSLSQH